MQACNMLFFYCLKFNSKPMNKNQNRGTKFYKTKKPKTKKGNKKFE